VTAALSRFLRFRDYYSGGRLVLSLIVGGAVFLGARYAMDAAVAATLAWVLGVASFLGLTLLAVIGATPQRIRARARAIDESATMIFILIVAGAAVSLGALGFVLQRPAGGALPATRVVIACLAIVASWLLAHTSFALHYAHIYYGDPGALKTEERGGLDFPGHEPPDYWDFLYYSLVVGMTCQVSDVQVTSREMRRVTLAHGVLSFIFNTGVLALAINILAGVL